MFEAMSTGGVGSGVRLAPGGSPRAVLARPWLGANSGFEATVKTLPGSSALAQFLSTLLTLAPAVNTGEPVGTEDMAGDPDVSPVPPRTAGAEVEVPPLPDWVDALDRFSAAGVAWAERGVPEEGPIAVVAGSDSDSDTAADRLTEALTGLPVSTLVEVVAAFKRVEAWAVAQAAAAAAELATRPEMNPLDRVRVPTGAGQASGLRAPVVAGTELALRLGISRASARRLVGIGTAMGSALSATGDALSRGLIDWTKAGVIAEGVAGVPWQVAQAVEDAVLPAAPRRTANQLRCDVAAALQSVDPEDAAQRHRRARAGRKVDHPQPLPDGMALIRAVLPADAAVRLDTTLHAAAIGAKSAGDSRTLDQLRADALDALTTHAWHLGEIGADSPGDAPGRGRAGRDGRARAALERPEGGSAPGLGGLVALLGPFATSASRERMRLSHVGRRAQVNVMVDLTTLLGLTDTPGTISGYGPVPAELARDLARDATWRRLITDPLTGAVLEVGTTRYRPPANLAELSRLRHPTCVNPICSVPSQASDLDHHRPWTPSDPDTSDPNLGPLCRTDHLLKTHAGYRVDRVGDTLYEITTPTGRRYRSVVPSHPLTVRLERTDRPPPF